MYGTVTASFCLGSNSNSNPHCTLHRLHVVLHHPTRFEDRSIEHPQRFPNPYPRSRICSDSYLLSCSPEDRYSQNEAAKRWLRKFEKKEISLCSIVWSLFVLRYLQWLWCSYTYAFFKYLAVLSLKIFAQKVRISKRKNPNSQKKFGGSTQLSGWFTYQLNAYVVFRDFLSSNNPPTHWCIDKMEICWKSLRESFPPSLEAHSPTTKLP